MKNLEKIKSATWNEVFEIWKQNEANEPHWIELYKNRGFNSWEDWRINYIKPLGLSELSWDLYKINKPLETVPNFFGGPFKAWKEIFYKKRKTLKFSKLAKLPEIKMHQGILKIKENFPQKTAFIGIIVNGRIHIIEGMHRSAAVALLKEEKRELKSEIIIALSKYPTADLPVVGQFLKGE